MSTTSANIEKVLHESIPGRGYAHSEDVNLLSEWRLAADPSAILTGSTAPVLDRFTTAGSVTNVTAIVFTAAHTTTDITVNQWRVPKMFAEGERSLKYIVSARKYDAGTVNSDLALTLSVRYQNPGAAWVLIDTISNVLAAPVTSGDIGWADYEFDVGAELETAGTYIRCGAVVVAQVSVNEAVGTSNRVEINGIERQYQRHAAVIDRDERGH